ncbi:SRPBCC domain-containing protein [Streptomyces sp. B6B3]|uniref:SRPBCC family protein n=1 Tax=Streptomyces sp. B6B3 TaxID=3153570 RepID=UPI00325D4BB7
MPTGLTKDAGWQIGVSRTLSHSPEAVWNLVSRPEGLALWLGAGADLVPERGATYRTESGVTGEVRSYHPGERIRLTHDSTIVQVTVTSAGGGRAVLGFHQERMASSEERERQRIHWRRALDRIGAALDGD